MAILARKNGVLLEGSVLSTSLDGTLEFKPMYQKSSITVKPDDNYQKVFSNNESFCEIDAWVMSRE